MLQYAPLEEAPAITKTTDEPRHERRRRRHNETDESSSEPTSNRIVVSAPPPRASTLDVLQPDLQRILPYACLLFFAVVIMFLADVRTTLKDIKELLTRDRVTTRSPFLRGF